jgi:hypothetical protein
MDADNPENRVPIARRSTLSGGTACAFAGRFAQGPEEDPASDILREMIGFDA